MLQTLLRQNLRRDSCRSLAAPPLLEGSLLKLGNSACDGAGISLLTQHPPFTMLSEKCVHSMMHHQNCMHTLVCHRERKVAAMIALCTR